jgi:hypothetical protein
MAVEKRKWTWLAMSLLVASLMTSLTLLALGFKTSATLAEPAPQYDQVNEAISRGLNRPGQDDQWLISDLLALRAELTRVRQIDKTIDYQGREFRILKSSLELLDPQACLEFESLEIRSARTAQGFSAKGQCPNGHPEAELTVTWNLERATLMAANGQSRTLDFKQ